MSKKKKVAKKPIAKAAKKKVAKVTKKKVAKKKKGAKKAPAKEGGLRKPQVRILKVLAKAKKPLTRTEISEKGDVDHAMLNSYLGANDESVRARNDKKVMVSLLTLKAVTFDAPESGQGMAYEITKTGKKLLAAVQE